MTTTTDSRGAARGRWLMLIVLPAAVAVLMITYGGFLFSFTLHLPAGLGDSALRAGLTFAPCAVVFGLCGCFWRRLPAGLHHLLAPAGCLVAVGGYFGLAAVLRSGGRFRCGGRGCGVRGAAVSLRAAAAACGGFLPGWPAVSLRVVAGFLPARPWRPVRPTRHSVLVLRSRYPRWGLVERTSMEHRCCSSDLGSIHVVWRLCG